jgi:hypothetical protein
LSENENTAAETQTVGWQVVDPEGNVVQSGDVVIAKMTDELAEALGRPTSKE